MKNQFKYAGLITAVLGLAAASYAAAQGARHVSADLNGYQEVNSISTTAKGRFTASIDDQNQIITYELSYEALEGATTTQAHIHFAQRSVNGAIHAFLCGGGGKPECPAIEGTVTGEITAADVLASVPDRGIEAGAFAEFVQAIRAGHTYVNVHTIKWPGGEIRGKSRIAIRKSLSSSETPNCRNAVAGTAISVPVSPHGSCPVTAAAPAPSLPRYSFP